MKDGVSVLVDKEVSRDQENDLLRSSLVLDLTSGSNVARKTSMIPKSMSI